MKRARKHLPFAGVHKSEFPRMMKAMAAVLILGSLSTHAQQSRQAPSPIQDGSQRPDYPRAVEFFHRLKDTLKENNRAGISHLIRYPVLVQLHGKKTRIRSRAEFLAHYDDIFNTGVRCEIFAASDKDIWGSSHGFTVTDGVLWFDDFSSQGTNNDPSASDFWTKGTFKVMTINNGSSYSCKK